MRNSIRESGRQNPRRVASRYVAGTRQVENPGWYDAQRNYEQAQQQYNQNQRQQQQMQSQARQGDTSDWAAALSGLSAGLSEVSLSSARNEAYSTPRYVDEEVI
ncbi:MAG: hypothetical protein U9R74_04860 [Pseudomonadota bacterium]|nr:hypothetical protein [Pseudomonadota bacterium]